MGRRTRPEESAAECAQHQTRVEDVQVARFERSSDISVIPKQKDDKAVRVVEIDVADGVRTLRIEIAR